MTTETALGQIKTPEGDTINTVSLNQPFRVETSLTPQNEEYANGNILFEKLPFALQVDQDRFNGEVIIWGDREIFENPEVLARSISPFGYIKVHLNAPSYREQLLPVTFGVSLNNVNESLADNLECVMMVKSAEYIATLDIDEVDGVRGLNDCYYGDWGKKSLSEQPQHIPFGCDVLFPQEADVVNQVQFVFRRSLESK